MSLVSLCIYILAIEPLANAIHANPDIKSPSLHQREFKLSLYEDDLLLDVSNCRKAFPLILKEYDMFGTLSNSKVNTQMRGTERLSQQRKGLIQLQPSPSPGNTPPSLFDLNYKPLLTIDQRLCDSSNQFRSWFGRMTLLKMDILHCIRSFKLSA